ncbi:MAG: elongation factor P [Candidatus Colwellbacteria bacterium CG10_big_fil_rev_8_21_14_0_10_42_22]|uniref:Elongation factor P n=1 Tax=Candidatus Colwellbacteria bacterium CG10_big_fil_rev_8_21_14_0_10_42_22 TaxID=1974540 RepID=A0A2H0VGC7_9BACT|nr:MAG: elongation factor P [Candidatus Colwellbacteria bacterium CG10_big_fil_rev_8_21_14_0_10_42_22]
MLNINDLKRGSLIVLDGEPHRVIFTKHTHMGRGSASLQAKVKNLINGKVLDRGFKPADEFEEAELEKADSIFIYSRNDEFWFHEVGNPASRFSINKEAIGEQADFLKSNMEVRAVRFKEKIINVELPIKVDYIVKEAPPNVRGNTAQGGTKQVTLETGAKISTPMFVEIGDKIRVNTETREYVERA